jgi:hypothetical protein
MDRTSLSVPTQARYAESNSRVVVDAGAAAQKVRAKVEKLLAMSASPHLEEARTSAFLACQLIREHGLQVNVHRSPAATASWPPPIRGTPQEAHSRPPWLSPHPRPPSRPLRCCGSPISPGDDALWFPGNGLRHPLCTP